MTYNLLTCAEMVVIAFAQSQAFNWTQFQLSDYQKNNNKGHLLKRDNCLITFFKILFATKDVLEDAHNSFLKEAEEDD